MKNYYGRLEDKDAMLLRWLAPGVEASVGTGGAGDAPVVAAEGEGGDDATARTEEGGEEAAGAAASS